jgi:hypothetical protein
MGTLVNVNRMSVSVYSTSSIRMHVNSTNQSHVPPNIECRVEVIVLEDRRKKYGNAMRVSEKQSRDPQSGESDFEH